MKDFHIAPYKFSTVHILSYYNYAKELSAVLQAKPLLIHDFHGKSAIHTCIKSKAYEPFEVLLKHFYDNESNSNS